MSISFDDVLKGGVEALDINQDFFQSIIFQGFDPARIRSKMTEKGATTSDIAKLVGLFLTRGSNIDKILSSTSSAGSNTVKKLVSTYGIKKNAKMGANRGDVITLTRIAAAFPDITALCAQKSVNMDGFRMGPVAMSRYTELEGWDDAFTFLLTPASFSLLDQKEFPWAKFGDCFAGIVHEISFLINPAYVQKAKENMEAAMDESKNYAALSYNSSLMTTALREKWTRKLLGNKLSECKAFLESLNDDSAA